ncbi:hypothetical protein SUGI_1131830 [Cryptomeria japonica]|nr:hypothetical protein SUGI_1131830 [Cryptomeria japonica]
MEQIWKFKQSNSHLQGVKLVERKKVKWTPPPPGSKKMNFDGASKGNPGLFGYGAVVRDEKGRLVEAVCGQVGIATNNIAKITSLEEGLKWATSNGVMKVVIDGDSKVILSGIIKKGFTNWRLNAWIPRIYCLLQNSTDYHLQHTFREGNQVADFLANQGIEKTLPAVLSSTNVGNKDLQHILIREVRSYQLYSSGRGSSFYGVPKLVLKSGGRKEDGIGKGGVVLEVDEEWASILGPYFNPAAILSDAESPDPEDEAQLAAEALRLRKEQFMAEAWEVFKVGVTNVDLGPFRRMMQKEDGWLSKGSIDKVVTIGMRVTTILRLL